MTAPAYDRELIARMLTDLASMGSSIFLGESISEQAELLIAADNADAAGVRTANATDPVRAQFEAWASSPDLDMDISRHPADEDTWAGQYIDAGLQRAWEAWQAALAQQPEAPAQAWRSPDEIPEVVSGCIAYLWVAVRSGHNGRVYSFPASYLNAVHLNRDDLDPIEGQERGNHWKNEPPGEHDECTMLATGWHKAQEHSEYDGFYSPLLDAADELVAWREVADYPGTEAPQPAIPEDTEYNRLFFNAARHILDSESFNRINRHVRDIERQRGIAQHTKESGHD